MAKSVNSIARKIFQQYNTNAMNLPVLCNLITRQLLSDMTSFDVLADMIKEHIRRDDNYTITRGKAGGVHLKKPITRKTKKVPT